MNPIINLLNWLTDMDWGWWPLLKYRPPKSQLIDNRVVAKITPFFGTVTGFIILLIINEFNSVIFVFSVVGVSWFVFFIFYRITFAVAWNIRASHTDQNSDEQ